MILLDPLRHRIVAANIQPDTVDFNMLGIDVLIAAKPSQKARDERFHDK
jgi:hypothetical protein